jgi:UDP-3-O-[3-hydroxymyristoyl] glucosamine N-acyltransferase
VLATWTVKSLSEKNGYDFKIYGPKEKPITDIAPLNKATRKDLSFCSSEVADNKTLESISKSKAGAILCNNKIRKSLTNTRLMELTNRIKDNHYDEKTIVFVDNPRLVFIKIAKTIKPENKIQKVISKHAVISDSARIGKDCYIGDFVVIGDGCTIGDNSIIQSRTTLQNCQIGNNCTVQSGTVIGEEGFAFERKKVTFELEKFPHYGLVIIKDNVQISANCSIARGSISDTVIEKGTKIDSLCHIAHNIHIGRNTQVTAGTVIGGSTTIGNNCWLGLNCTIKNKITVGNKVIVGSGSSVIHDISDEDIVAGNPAKSIKNKLNLGNYKLFLMAGQTKARLNTNEKQTEPLESQHLEGSKKKRNQKPKRKIYDYSKSNNGYKIKRKMLAFLYIVGSVLLYSV